MFNYSFFICFCQQNIFYISWIVEKEPLIKGADIKTFEVLNNDFSKDKDNVYFRTDREEDLDSKSFKILNLNSQNRNGYYVKDKNGVYYFDYSCNNQSQR